MLLEEHSIGLVSGDNSIDLNAAADTETSLHTAPEDKDFYPVMLILDEFSAAVTAAVITAGKAGGSCDEFGTYTLTNISGTSGYLILMPVPNSTPVECTKIAAGEAFAIEITTAEGSALTCRAEVLGIQKPAA
jgi:hypothetical protein